MGKGKRTFHNRKAGGEYFGENTHDRVSGEYLR